MPGDLKTVVTEQCLPPPANLLGERLDVLGGETFGRASQRGDGGLRDRLPTPCSSLRCIRGLQGVVVFQLTSNRLELGGDATGELIVFSDRFLGDCERSHRIACGSGKAGFDWRLKHVLQP